MYMFCIGCSPLEHWQPFGLGTPLNTASGGVVASSRSEVPCNKRCPIPISDPERAFVLIGGH